MKTSSILVVTVILAIAVTASAHWDESMPAKWVQFPDLAPTGMDVNCTEADPNYILADDFLCTETGRITDIHIWGSWFHDQYPDGDPGWVYFTLSLHEDIPDTLSPTGYSMPGNVLWVRSFDAHEFQLQPWATDLQEGWFNPPQDYDPFGDTVCWQYNFAIPETAAFLQQGTEEKPKVYWLDVQAYSPDPYCWFGWKTSLDHWNDDGVYGYGVEPYFGPWYELIYPLGHQMELESIDLAFVIQSKARLEDYGDAPDPTYPTYAINGGASHTIIPGFQMGALIDAEPDGIPDPNALGDDMNNLQDEDGVVFTSPLIPGGLATVDVDMTFSLGGVLDAWLDFDGDGGWAELGDYVLAGVPLTGGVINNLVFPVPASAAPGQTFARFRLTQNGITTYTGGAPDGEVEDYEIFIEGEEWKWFQRPDLNDTGIDIDGTVSYPGPFVLADDYLCTAPGRVTEIYVWASWEGDYLPWDLDPTAVDFTLSIHEDIPQGPAGEHSRPGEVLWLRTFHAGVDYTAEIWQEQISEGWMTPPDDYHFPGDTICWLYTFYITPEEAFHQTGMPDSAIVYWLDVQAYVHDDSARWGWKTTDQNWNDDAVWGMGFEPFMGPWSELRYPPQHAWAGASIDLAFGLKMGYGTGVPDELTPESYKLRQNAPNPFNPKTTIRYDVPAEGGHVEIRIVDVAGRLVRTLVNERQTEGEKSVEWDGRDEAGNQMATGVYFYRLTAAGVEESRKMLLLK
ncbi:MAG: FlgD immunoglobulin-like domain containing protein [Candidatus Eisenbacteria bacterium]